MRDEENDEDKNGISKKTTTEEAKIQTLKKDKEGEEKEDNDDDEDNEGEEEADDGHDE